jgi:hypothetical protein
MNKKPEDKVSQYPNSIETRVALVEMSISHINDALLRIETEIKDSRKEMRSEFKWILAIIAGLAGVMAHGFHWF